MFAVLKTGGKQYKVTSGDVLRVEKLAADAGETVQFNDILMVGATVGTPFVEGAGVQAEVVDQIKGEKTINFVRRRRKHSSKRTKGHRQQLTLVRVTEILESGADKSGVKAAIGSGRAPAGSGSPAASPAAEAPAGGTDDLKKLSGVGPALEKKLIEAGIASYAQIAGWTDVELAALDEALRNKAEKEGWIAQAQDMNKG